MYIYIYMLYFFSDLTRLVAQQEFTESLHPTVGSAHSHTHSNIVQVTTDFMENKFIQKTFYILKVGA